MSNLRKVSAGEPLAISATTWNQLVGIVSRSQGSGQNGTRGFRQSVTCIIRNDTGGDLPQYGIVGLGDPVIPYDATGSDFFDSIVLKGVLAAGGDYDLKWGVTLSPIAAGEFGAVVVQGLTYAKLDSASEQAGPTEEGDVDFLTEADCGLARVLWRDAGSGNKWAVICLG